MGSAAPPHQVPPQFSLDVWTFGSGSVLTSLSIVLSDSHQSQWFNWEQNGESWCLTRSGMVAIDENLFLKASCHFITATRRRSVWSSSSEGRCLYGKYTEGKDMFTKQIPPPPPRFPHKLFKKKQPKTKTQRCFYRIRTLCIQLILLGKKFIFLVLKTKPPQHHRKFPL